MYLAMYFDWPLVSHVIHARLPDVVTPVDRASYFACLLGSHVISHPTYAYNTLTSEVQGKTSTWVWLNVCIDNRMRALILTHANTRLDLPGES